LLDALRRHQGGADGAGLVAEGRRDDPRPRALGEDLAPRRLLYSPDEGGTETVGQTAPDDGQLEVEQGHGVGHSDAEGADGPVDEVEGNDIAGVERRGPDARGHAAVAGQLDELVR